MTHDSAQTYRIGALAKKANKTVRTIHFYEELGLLSPAARSPGGFRLYNDQALDRIHWIERLQVLGCSARRAMRAWWRRSMGTGRVGCVWSVRCERAWRGDAESAARSAAIAAGSAPLKVFFCTKQKSQLHEVPLSTVCSFV